MLNQFNHLHNEIVYDVDRFIKDNDIELGIYNDDIMIDYFKDVE